jgi:hypothetical protein
MTTDKSEETGMGLLVRSAGSFHGFRVSRGDINNYFENCLETFYRLTASFDLTLKGGYFVPSFVISLLAFCR